MPVERSPFFELIPRPLTREQRLEEREAHREWYRGKIRELFATLPFEVAVDALAGEFVKKDIQSIHYQRLAFIDHLLQVPNRRAFELALNDTAYAKKPAGVGFIDLDRLKKANTRFGHDGGNVALLAWVEAIKEEMLVDNEERVVPPWDVNTTMILARIGGDEIGFVIGFGDSELYPADKEGYLQRKRQELKIIADRARARVARREIFGRNIQTGETEQLHLTTSIGVGVYEPGDNMDRIRESVDEALMEAKRKGRNRTTTVRRPVVV